MHTHTPSCLRRVSSERIVLAGAADTVQRRIRPCSRLSIFQGSGGFLMYTNAAMKCRFSSGRGKIPSSRRAAVTISPLEAAASILSRLFPPQTMEPSPIPNYIQPCCFPTHTVALTAAKQKQQQQKKRTHFCTPTNPKRQNPGAKNNSLE